ncbi:NAD-dependent 4,6-dehydratase LegB [Parabacteroides hominis]|uniref:GDP-mannose 4,6-dehydratase n=1 Tax=Parabacteroides hominis TaxID=2763057 RepID=A0ABR7DIK4_9BACT|nr:NAD-dependent 4,6-dehydratase LegB [Parabacteroides hominis]MBC5631271.1 GDP-mannose 4,6-dehydratase [Parabacteroides hominis]MBD9167433.1 NAD-dependent epimerase/dehydratase family protein [Parabacteroides johnsonii]
MQKVLVTGADGFIGSHLTEMLLEKGYDVKALSYYNSFNDWGWLNDIKHPNLEVVTGDVRDPYFCKHITKDVEIIFHLAALIAIPYSYVAPDSYVDTNIKGTLNICQAAKENGVKRVLVTSTSEIYGTARYVPIDENHPKQPQSPYSATKIAADAIAMSFYNTFSLPVVLVRPFNAYGPRQSARAIIPTIITQIANGKKEIKLGDLTPTRDFNFVKDTCKGFIELSKCDAAIGQEVNVCSNSEISMRDTLQLIAKLMNSDVSFIEDHVRIRPKNSEVFRLWGDNTKIKSLTGYEPSYSLEEGLKETIAWFLDKDNLKKYKADIYNV